MSLLILTSCGSLQDTEKAYDEKADVVARLLAGEEVAYVDYNQFVFEQASGSQYYFREACHRKGITDEQLLKLRFPGRDNLVVRYKK